MRSCLGGKVWRIHGESSSLSFLGWPSTGWLLLGVGEGRGGEKGERR